MHMLDKLDSGIVDRLKSLTPDQRRCVLATACNSSSELIAGLEPEIKLIIVSFYQTSEITQSQITAVVSFLSWADQRYLDLRDRGVDQDIWMNWFLKARLAAAIAAGHSGSAWKDTADAIYELTVMRSDPSEFLRQIKSDTNKQ